MPEPDRPLERSAAARLSVRSLDRAVRAPGGRRPSRLPSSRLARSSRRSRAGTRDLRMAQPQATGGAAWRRLRGLDARTGARPGTAREQPRVRGWRCVGIEAEESNRFDVVQRPVYSSEAGFELFARHGQAEVDVAEPVASARFGKGPAQFDQRPGRALPQPVKQPSDEAGSLRQVQAVLVHGARMTRTTQGRVRPAPRSGVGPVRHAHRVVTLRA